MNAQQLRNSILQEAIEGRLVPQDRNDEPASMLLNRIREEKKRLVKEGKLKKKDLEEKPISEDEKPFEIPDSWEWCRLINLCKIIHYGYTASAAPTGNSKLLRITDIQDDKVNWSSVPFCSIKEKDLETYQLHNRDILIARTGGTIGKTYIVRELNDIAVFASYLIRAIPLDNIFEEYIKLFMGSPYYWSQLTDAATGTQRAGGIEEGYALVSFFGKIDYNWKDLLLASFTIRHDGYPCILAYAVYACQTQRLWGSGSLRSSGPMENRHPVHSHCHMPDHIAHFVKYQRQ